MFLHRSSLRLRSFLMVTNLMQLYALLEDGLVEVPKAKVNSNKWWDNKAKLYTENEREVCLLIIFIFKVGTSRGQRISGLLKHLGNFRHNIYQCFIGNIVINWGLVSSLNVNDIKEFSFKLKISLDDIPVAGW